MTATEFLSPKKLNGPVHLIQTEAFDERSLQRVLVPRVDVKSMIYQLVSLQIAKSQGPMQETD